MATLRQKVDALLLRAEEADNNSNEVEGQRVCDILEGKKVEVFSRPSSRQTFGKCTPNFDVWIDGKRMDWHSRKNEARNIILDAVDPVRIAERTAHLEKSKADAIRREAEQKAAEERMKPLIEAVHKRVDEMVGVLMTDWRAADWQKEGMRELIGVFTEAEILRTIQRVVSELTGSVVYGRRDGIQG